MATSQDSSVRSRDPEVMKARFEAAVMLHHFKEAWDAALMLQSPQLWQALGEAYLQDLDIDSAIRWCSCVLAQRSGQDAAVSLTGLVFV